MHPFGQAAALAMLAAVAAAVVPPPADTIRAAAAIKTPALWVDARKAEEFGKAHYPGALSLSEAQWEENLPAVLERWTPGQTVIVYCDGGACKASQETAARLREMNVRPVRVLRGGWPALRSYVH